MSADPGTVDPLGMMPAAFLRAPAATHTKKKKTIFIHDDYLSDLFH